MTLFADIAYALNTGERPRYYANDHSRDTVVIDPRAMAMVDGRAAGPGLDDQGFVLVPHVSAVGDFTDAAAVQAVHPAEIAALVQSLSGADQVFVAGPGILRFSEKSGLAGSLNNSMPARFAHVDITDETAKGFVARSAPEGKAIRRHAHYNVWRAFSQPPQDVPLAVCDARSVAPQDLITADAIFDEPGKPEWSFDGWVVAHNPAHRWHWFANMTRDEALVFKTNDSLAGAAHCVPHVAFDDPECPADAPPRASIEMRAVAFWYE
jgi:hypothetical protein